MMETLTSTLAIPKRLSKTETYSQKTEAIIRIGNMAFTRPNNNIWALAQQSAEDLQELVAEFLLGVKNKFYKKIIEDKASHAIKKMHYTSSTIDMTAKVSKVLLNAKTIQQKLERSRFRKNIIKSTVDKLVAINAAMKLSSAALNNRNNNNIETPNATITQLRAGTSPVTKNKLNNTKIQTKTKSIKQKTNSNIQNDAARENKQAQQHQQQTQQHDDNSITSQNSHTVAANMRKQRWEQLHTQEYDQRQQRYPPTQQYAEHYQQQQQYDFNHQYNYDQQYNYNQPNQQQFNYDQQSQQYDIHYHNNNSDFHYNAGRGGRGPGRGRERIPGRGRMPGRGRNSPRQSISAKRNFDGTVKDSNNNHQKR
jgi:hypothetical protein